MRLGIRFSILGLGKTSLRRVEEIRLIGLDLEQIIVAELDDDFGQIPLGIERIAGNQTERWILFKKLAQMSFQHFWLGAFVPSERPLSQAGFEVLDEHVEHLQGMVLAVKALLRGLTIDGYGKHAGACQHDLQPT